MRIAPILRILSPHSVVPRRVVGILAFAFVLIPLLLASGQYVGSGRQASAEDPTPTPTLGPFTPSFSWTFDDAAATDPNTLPSSDQCVVGVPCKSMWLLEIPDGQPMAPITGMYAPDPSLQGAGAVLDGTIVGQTSGWGRVAWGQFTCPAGTVGEFAHSPIYAASTNRNVTTSDVADYSKWPIQLDGITDDYLGAHPGSELISRRRIGQNPPSNALYFSIPGDPPTVSYILVVGDPTSPESNTVTFCSPFIGRAVYLGVSADNPATPQDEGGIPLQTCQTAETNTMSVSLDRDDTPPGDPIVVSDTAYCLPNTPTGLDVSVPLNGGTEYVSGVELTFSEVTSPGSTAIVTTTSGPPPPTGFEIVGLSELPLYFDINTTGVEYYPDVTICVRYDETQVTGPEANLKLMHYVDDAFEDVTTSVDTDNDIICGTATHLSEFIIAELAPIATPTETPTPTPTVTPTSTSLPGGNAPTVITTVAVGGQPLGVASNPATHKVYIANNQANGVAVLWDTTNQVGPTISVDSSPRGVAVNGETNRIYVSNSSSGSVSVIAGATDEVIHTVTVHASPHGVAVNPVTNRIYVANYVSGILCVIDGVTHSVQDISLSSGPWWVAANPVTNRVYATFPDSNSVSVIDGQTGTWLKDVSVCAYPLGIAVNDATNRIYVACAGSDQLSVIEGSTDTWSKNIPAGINPYGVAVNRNTNRIYVAENQGAAVDVFDGETDQQLWTVQVGGLPWGLTVNEALNRVYVTHEQGWVDVIQDYPVPGVVGGRAAYPQLEREAASNGRGSSGSSAFALAGVAVVVAALLVAVGWYARRRRTLCLRRED